MRHDAASRAIAALASRLAYRPGRGVRVHGRTWLPEPDAVPWLAEWLYQRLFIDWTPPTGPWALDVAGAPWFVAQLAARAAGATYLQEGFRLVQRAPGGIFVRDDAIRLWVTEHAAVRPWRARTGAAVRVRLPCAREAAVPGFFTVVSRRGRLARGEPHLKLYVNATPEGAQGLVEGLLVDRLVRPARFEAKVVNDPNAYGRRDTALLYVAPASWRRVLWWVRGVQRREPAWFRAGTPPFTLPLLRGVSAAESPEDDTESFGGHRCRLVAEGLVAALRAGTPWRREVEAAFAQEGLSYQAPWLGALGAGWTRT